MVDKRATCINCIDGRVQKPVYHWIKDNYKVEYIDIVTEVGADGFLSDSANLAEETYKKIKASIELNHSSIIFIVGHHDCKGNPVDKAEHKQHIISATKRLQGDFPQTPVKGLWVNEKWEVENIP